MSQTLCLDDDGRAHRVPSTTLTVRPAVYGILAEGEQLLLQRSGDGRFFPPGRILRRHELPHCALRLYFRATAGFTPVVNALLHLETAHYIDPAQQAWQLTRLYYLVSRPPSGRLLPLADSDAVRPHWLPFADLTPDALTHGWQAIRLAKVQVGSIW